MEAEAAAITNRAAEDAAQDITAAFVAWPDAVGDGETERPDVIGDDAESDINAFLFGSQASSLTWQTGILPVRCFGRLEAHRPGQA